MAPKTVERACTSWTTNLSLGNHGHRSRSHEVLASGLIRFRLMVSKRSFAFLIN